MEEFRIIESSPNEITVNREPNNIEEAEMMKNSVIDSIVLDILKNDSRIEFG